VTALQLSIPRSSIPSLLFATLPPVLVSLDIFSHFHSPFGFLSLCSVGSVVVYMHMARRLTEPSFYLSSRVPSINHLFFCSQTIRKVNQIAPSEQ
jgi:hypothetical protein